MMDKIQISLTQFIDFSLKQGIPRINHVKHVKDQGDYHPAKDFWKQLRDAIRKFHENGCDPSILDEAVSRSDQRRIVHYAEAVKQYKQFCKNKDISWFEPTKSHWSNDDLLVRSGPELGLTINGIPHLIKLYFKESKEILNKRGTATTLTLMSESKTSKDHPDAILSVLNVKKCKLFPLEQEISDVMRLSLHSEAQNFIYIWNHV